MDDDTKRRFVQVPLSIVQADISPAAFRLWCVLAARANSNDECWPGKTKLCAEANLSITTVKRALVELEAAGLVSITRRKVSDKLNDTNIYKVRGRVKSDLPLGSNPTHPRVKSDPNLYPASISKITSSGGDADLTPVAQKALDLCLDYRIRTENVRSPTAWRNKVGAELAKEHAEQLNRHTNPVEALRQVFNIHPNDLIREGISYRERI